MVGFRWTLSEPLQQFRPTAHHPIEPGILVFLVGTHGQQILMFTERCQSLSDMDSRVVLGRVNQLRHEPTIGPQHIDGGEVPGVGQLLREHDMAVQKAAGGLADRVVAPIMVRQHGIERGHTSLLAISRAFQDLGEEREDGRWIPVSRGRFSGGQSDFALGGSDAGE